MITLLLFTTTVPMAVFGQHNFKAGEVKTWFTSVRDHAQDQWPAARKQIGKSLPDTVQGLAAHLNDYSPSAGTPTLTYCIADGLWQGRQMAEKSEPHFSI